MGSASSIGSLGPPLGPFLGCVGVNPVRRTSCSIGHLRHQEVKFYDEIGEGFVDCARGEDCAELVDRNHGEESWRRRKVRTTSTSRQEKDHQGGVQGGLFSPQSSRADAAPCGDRGG